MAKTKRTVDPGADVAIDEPKAPRRSGKPATPEDDAGTADSPVPAASAETPPEESKKPDVGQTASAETSPEESKKPEAEAYRPATPPRLRQSTRPFCPYHPQVQCESRRSDQFFTRYYCPEEGCTYSVKVPRPRRPDDVYGEQEDFSAR